MPRLVRLSALLLPALALAACAFAPAARCGQITVFSTDFETSIPAEMSTQGSSLQGTQGYSPLGPPGNQFGTRFLRYTSVPLFDTKLVLRDLPPHTSVSVEFLLGLIDSWDGTELFKFLVDGQERFSHWFQLATGDASSYLAPPGALLSSGVNLGFSNGSFFFRDRAYNLSLEPAFQSIPHTADSLVVIWRLGAVSGPAASQWQGGNDESWAIDNVRVKLIGPLLDAPLGGESALALSGTHPNPSRGDRMLVRFALPSSEPASLELFDVAGRRIAARDVGSLGPGVHAVELAPGSRVRTGVYLLRLTQSGAERRMRAVVTE
jgi:hypothetical protein